MRSLVISVFFWTTFCLSMDNSTAQLQKFSNIRITPVISNEDLFIGTVNN